MAFYITLSEDSIAEQIALLLNQHNKLKKVHNVYSILNGTSDYFIETHLDRVIGCAALDDALYAEHSRIKHVCVAPEYRRMGIAKKVINTAINNCSTKYVYATIRQENLPSLNLWASLGFVYIKEMCNGFIVTVGRKTRNG